MRIDSNLKKLQGYPTYQLLANGIITAVLIGFLWSNAGSYFYLTSGDVMSESFEFLDLPDSESEEEKKTGEEDADHKVPHHIDLVPDVSPFSGGRIALRDCRRHCSAFGQGKLQKRLHERVF